MKPLYQKIDKVGKYRVAVFVVKKPSGGLTNRKAENIMYRLLFNVSGAPRQVQAAEEEAYGLPSFSLYWNYDARSFCGKWYFTGCEEDDICWGFIADDTVCKAVNDIISNMEMRLKDDEIVFAAVWEG